MMTIMQKSRYEIQQGGVHSPSDRHLIIPELQPHLLEKSLIRPVRITAIGYFPDLKIITVIVRMAPPNGSSWSFCRDQDGRD